MSGAFEQARDIVKSVEKIWKLVEWDRVSNQILINLRLLFLART